jgi:hypothetical protein
MSSDFFQRAASLALVAVASGLLALTTHSAAARSRAKAPSPEVTDPQFNGQAALAVISIKDQRISLYDKDGAAKRGRVSSGQTGYETPVGVFSVLQKEVEHHSNLYDDALMPYMQRITWSGVAMHAGALPGYPASHGCVRLPYSFAQQIFSTTKVGMRVVISRNDIAPVDITSPLLFKPEPISEMAVATPTAYQPSNGDESASILEPDVSNWPERQVLLETLMAEAKEKADQANVAVQHWKSVKADLRKYRKELALISKRKSAAAERDKAAAKLAKAEERLSKAKSQRAVRRAEKTKALAEKALKAKEDSLEKATDAAKDAEEAMKDINEAIAEAEAAKTAAVAEAAAAKRSTLPVSVFVSAKEQKLYVRQGNEPVFDAKVAIADPDMPIGTHVFTALDFANDGNDVRWNVVSISRDDDYDRYDRYDRGERRRTSYVPPPTDEKAAAAALERVSIPADVRARISKYVWPGSSLIISDEGMSKETGKGTDFIVVASDEPQGALKIRPRRPPPSYYSDYYDDDYYYYSRPYRRNDRRPQRYYKKGLFGWW